VILALLSESGIAIPLVASIVIPVARLVASIVTESVIERPPKAVLRVIVAPSSEESKTITSPGAQLELATVIASRNEQSLVPGGVQSAPGLFTTSAFVVTVIVHGWAKAGAAYTIQIKAHSRARTLESSPRFMAKASFILVFWSNYNLLKKKVKTYERDCEKQ
jgi:hypothetical protein